MRESVGSTWVYMIVITFTFIFAGFLALVIAYSKAYKIKNEVTLIVEKYEGISDTSIEIIKNYVKNAGYSATGKCKSETGEEVIGLTSDGTYEEADSKKKYLLCFKKSSSESKNTEIEITTFYKFTLPIIGDITTFDISGETNTMNYIVWSYSTP